MVALAAIRLKNRKIFTGETHADAVALIADSYPHRASILDFAEDGFLTTRGRFLDRERAYELAQSAKQLHQKARDYEAVQRRDSSKILTHADFTPADKICG